jgi:hypothetical protein
MNASRFAHCYRVYNSQWGKDTYQPAPTAAVLKATVQLFMVTFAFSMPPPALAAELLVIVESSKSIELCGSPKMPPPYSAELRTSVELSIVKLDPVMSKNSNSLIKWLRDNSN